ncbi:mucin-16-like isoform X4 [Polypterus senegalus]|uniref:mucin-16-like isoform X4 n=1 Tax=Polypterus senegalus TaxID=55291 RepID=UPI001966037B|nr:mucin-16-like isoform X4 [Polypterus senegalus]
MHLHKMDWKLHFWKCNFILLPIVILLFYFQVAECNEGMNEISLKKQDLPDMELIDRDCNCSLNEIYDMELANEIHQLGQGMTPPDEVTLQFFINFTVTSQVYNQSLPSTRNTILKNITSMVSQAFMTSSISETFLGCPYGKLSPDQGKIDVYIICDFSNNTLTLLVNRVTVYRVLKQVTSNVTSLGPYSIARDSLYVNGYHELETSPEIQMLPFTINFTLNNLQFNQRLSSTVDPINQDITSLVSQALLTGSYAPGFSKCQPASLSSDPAGTAVYLTCNFVNMTSTPPINRVKIYRELKQNTNSGSSLGSYVMAKDSLYVNGYRELETPLPPPMLSFFINFTLTNLMFNQSLSSESSPINLELVSLVSQALLTSSYAPGFSKCQPASLSSDPAGTAVYLTCNFVNMTSTSPINRVTIYRELKQNTNNGSSLGSYVMAKDSLYVNGYRELETPLPPPMLNFFINFTLTNLMFNQSLSSESSPINLELGSLVSQALLTGSYAPAFSKCQPASLSSDPAGTAVYLTCNFVNMTSTPPINRVTIYRELKQNTNSGSSLGSYVMAKDSLYVNGYRELETPLPPPMLNFFINFTLTNLMFNQSLSSESSPINHELGSLVSQALLTGSYAPAFSKCQPASLSSDPAGTAVYLTCNFVNMTSTPPINRVTIYRELKQNTNSGSSLGSYVMAKDSLYVNGYRELETPLPPPMLSFFINFTLTNLIFNQSLSSESNPINHELGSLVSQALLTGSYAPAFSKCQPASLSSDPAGTAVYLTCNFVNMTSTSPINRVTIYRELKQNTNSGSSLGSYVMAKDSLYVNGYRELETPLPPPMLNFFINFTLTNLRFNQSLSSESSPINHELVSLVCQALLTGSYAPAFSKCQPASLSSDPAGTAVYLTCNFVNMTSTPPINRVTIYRELKQNTNSGSSLGSYVMAKDSLYVNGYRELETPLPPPMLNFFINFTLTNLMFNQSLSSESNPINHEVVSLVSHAFLSGSISSKFSGCQPASFSSDPRGTAVYLMCSFRNDTSMPPIDRVTVYRELKQSANNYTSLGPYSMASGSLYVNGYHVAETSPDSRYQDATLAPSPTNTYTVNFTITNVAFVDALLNPQAEEYKYLTSSLEILTGQIFNSSQLQNNYEGCHIVLYSPTEYPDETKVNMVCDFRISTSRELTQKVLAFKIFREATNNITTLGPYTLDHNSLYVDGYNEVYDDVSTASVFLPTILPQISNPGDAGYSLDFTIFNRNYTADLDNPKSPYYTQLVYNITSMLEALYEKSTLGGSLRYCYVSSLSPNPGHGVHVSSVCVFRPTTGIDSDTVMNQFAKGTGGLEELGDLYELQDRRSNMKGGDNRDLIQKRFPFWAIGLLCLGALLVIAMCWLCLLLVKLWRRRQISGLYDVLNLPYGEYYTHLK